MLRLDSLLFLLTSTLSFSDLNNNFSPYYFAMLNTKYQEHKSTEQSLHWKLSTTANSAWSSWSNKGVSIFFLQFNNQKFERWHSVTITLCSLRVVHSTVISKIFQLHFTQPEPLSDFKSKAEDIPQTQLLLGGFSQRKEKRKKVWSVGSWNYLSLLLVVCKPVKRIYVVSCEGLTRNVVEKWNRQSSSVASTSLQWSPMPSELTKC